MKRSGRIPRKRGLPRGSQTRRGRRSSAERERIYGTPERIDWMHRQPCCVTGIPGNHIVIAHVKTGGTGRKADAEWTVPMYGPLHQMLHLIGIRTFETRYNIDLELAAVATQQRWLAHEARNPEHISTIVKRVMEEL